MTDMLTRSPRWTVPSWVMAACLAATFAPALGQAQTTDGAATEAPATDAPAAEASAAETPIETNPTDEAARSVLSTGEEVAQNPQGPSIYLREEHGDWEIRCLEAPEGQEDPCQMFQRMSDQAGNPTADINIFDLPDGGEIVAGATVLTPLQTLLTAQVTVSVDGGSPRRYPFSFCDAGGCYARMGFTADDISRFRRGAAATVIVVPAQAPDQQAQLTLSLSGFTAGYEAVTVANE
ncbi:MAG: invasion associated locus B family protein [Jannaschia sp.]